MKILVVGGGGREHALAWKAAQSAGVDRVFVAPGNAGTAHESGLCNVPIDAGDTRALVRFAAGEGIELTIIGPEGPLVAGIADQFHAAGLRCLGPGREAASLEGSKTFAKDFLARHGIPSARYRSFTDAAAAADYIRREGAPITVKADGLAAGKGVVVARTEAEALAAVDECLSAGRFGAAGRRIVVEECLSGEEASFIVLCDGNNVLPFASSQDHKARDDGDRGPNTGGMGAYSPAPVVSPEIHRRVMQRVIEPTVRAMREEGRRYVGFLYAGLMIAADGTPNVLEFNCRFGDPETQPIMLRLKSDLIALCQCAVEGTLEQARANWDERAALGVVLAAEGYPSEVRKGDPISGLDRNLPEGLKIFHAATAEQDGRIVTAGGRVLCVTALGANVQMAQRHAYQAIEHIHWNGMFCRTDIGSRAILRERDSENRAPGTAN